MPDEFGGLTAEELRQFEQNLKKTQELILRLDRVIEKTEKEKKAQKKLLRGFKKSQKKLDTLLDFTERVTRGR